VATWITTRCARGPPFICRFTHRGALLFVGDEHAAQGDGELTGAALETSMQVEFTGGSHQGQGDAGTACGNDAYLMSMGIANSLPEATATTQLVNWIQRDYKLGPNEAAIVLGTTIQYDIAELVDPLVHVVAKVRKDVLAQLK
jgi:amidase